MSIAALLAIGGPLWTLIASKSQTTKEEVMSKVKFKCDHCKIPTQRKSDRIVTKNGKRYCSENCKDKGNNHE